MIRETAKIIAIEEQAEKKLAVVECISRSACSSCHNSNSCGVGVVAKTFSDKVHHLKVPYKEGMEKNTFVELQISNVDLIKSASIAYLIPLIFFIGGALIARQFSFIDEGLLILIAIVCAVIGFTFTRLISNKLYPKDQFNNVMSCESKNYDG